MKYRFLLVLIVLFEAMLSCDKEKQERRVTCTTQLDSLDYYLNGSLCTSDLCKEYQTIWKELFLEKNNLSQNYFENHIILFDSKMQTWDNGVLFIICYRVKIDWAVAHNCDQFIIKINKGNNLYSAINLPRDIYLSKDNIRIAINNRAFSSNLINLSNAEILQFNSIKNAMDKLINAANVNTLCPIKMSMDEPTGHIFLHAYAKYKYKGNSCISGYIDLINGNTIVTDSPCWIN